MDELARYYEILGLKPDASAEELRQAYRDLVKVWHPDRFSHDERLRLKAQDKLKEINGAYEVVRAAMFAAGADPGPQVNPEPEPAPEVTREAGKHFISLRMLWVAVGAVALIIVLLTTSWLRPGNDAELKTEATIKHPQSAPSHENPKPPSHPGPVIADQIYTAADDFIVDIYHNGERVPDSQRKLIGESFGATCEKIELTVKEGDWLVFNVVNDRLRWNAAYYFAAAGMKQDQTIGFASELGSGNWTFCDDPGNVSRFIAEPEFLTENKVLIVQRRWDRGDELMKQFVKGWQGQPVWGRSRNTWIKFKAARQAEVKAP
jgi:hypothetical protein